MKQHKCILLIYTGGTIGMKKSNDGSLQPFDFTSITQNIPELNKFDLTLNAISFQRPIDSSNVSPDVWIKIARIIKTQYNKHDGFIVLHGSDTMAYTASALSFLLEGLNKPVILTGSQLPIGARRTDAKENLITSIEIAASQKIPEVSVYFESKLLRGNRTVKVNAEHFEAFDSPNFPPLAEAGVNIKYQPINYKNKTTLKIHDKMDSRVAILKLHPGINKSIVNAFFNNNCKAVILETFGSGNATTQSWFLDILKTAIEKGVIILNVSQCLAGRVSQGLYQTSSQLEKIGVISGGDITTEAALTKLMFLLGQNLTSEKIKLKLTTSIRGELS